MNDDAFESLCARFEEVWACDGPCPIVRLLEASSADRERLLIELIAIDLEFRWRRPSGQADPPARLLLEDYIAMFPELGPLDRIAPELIGEEYRVRRRWGDRPAHGEFLARFPSPTDYLQAELRRIDHELERESADHRSRMATSPGSEPIEAAPGLPRLSHRDLRLRRLIGAGGIGKVYRAWQHSADRDVAVKFLRKSLLQDPRVVRRFLGEAAILAGMSHPGIVATRGLGRTDGGSAFIVMDLVDGPDLARLCADPANPGRRGPPLDTRGLPGPGTRARTRSDPLRPQAGEPAARSLRQDPRDGFRPGAITGRALARHDRNRGDRTLHGTGAGLAIVGSRDHRTDVYGIGAVLFALLTGRPPHPGRRLPDIFAEVVCARPVVSPEQYRPDLPTPIVAFCRRCLAKPPHERHSTMREATLALLDLIGYDDPLG